MHCHDPNLGFATKERAWKGADRKCNLGVIFTLLECERVWENEPTHSQMNSHFGTWSPYGIQNFQKVILGIKNHWIEKFFIPLEISWHRCLKWACMTHSSIYNISYAWKKNRKSMCQFDFWPLKVKNRFELCAWRWRATYRWKSLNKGYNFSFCFISIEGLQKKLWASKVAWISISKISKLSTWESWDKMTFGCNPLGQAHRIL